MCASGRLHGSRGAVLHRPVLTTSKQLKPAAICIRKQGEPLRIMLLPPTDLKLEYLPPRDGITCLSIDSGPPRRPILMNAISCHSFAEGNACKAANCSCKCVKLSCNRVQGEVALRRVRGLFSPVSTNNFISD